MRIGDVFMPPLCHRLIRSIAFVTTSELQGASTSKEGRKTKDSI